MNALLRYRRLIAIFGVSVVLLAAAAAIAWVRLHAIREPLVLHYSPYTGINQIGSVVNLLGVAATGLVLVGVNALIAFALEDRERLWADLLALMTLFLSALLFIAFMAIISVNS